MLGVILLYVGMVLMSNGLHRLEGIPDKSNVVMNIFTGGLGLILNIIVIACMGGLVYLWQLIRYQQGFFA